MSADARERPKLNLGDDLDLSDFGVEEAPLAKTEPTAKQVAEVSKDAGFASRSPAKPTARRRRGKRSPFQIPLAIKSRAGMRELFQDLGDLLDTHDHTTLERAIAALIKETGDKTLMERFRRLTEGE